jgi:hypothetical protein
MSRLSFVIVFCCGALARAEAPLNHSQVGVYGTLFDFCDYSVYKFAYKDDTQLAQSLPKWQQMLSDAVTRGKRNLVLLYTFDRIKHSRPIEEYIRNTDKVLQALDLKAVYALCLSEENVTWANGLQVLNALYDHIKAKYKIPVYQWLSMPCIPHPKLRTDGTIIDPYGFDGVRFRRYLQKYLATGKPVIDCIWASPPHSNFSLDATPPQQVAVCREFNVPMFFYAVDTKLGSPAVWLRSDDPAIVATREWVMKVVSEVHRQGARGLPLESANFSTGKPVEVSGDEQGVYEYADGFAAEDFLDDATIRGFWGLTWDGEKEMLACDPGRARLPEIELQYHFTSPFQISEVKAALTGSQQGGHPPITRLGVSANGHQWQDEAEAKAAGEFSLAAAPTAQAAFSGREFWVRVVVSGPVRDQAGPSVLDQLRVTCRTALPERRETVLEPGANGTISCVEDFASQKYLHLADTKAKETLEWHRGVLSCHGVKGQGGITELRWKFVSAKPLRDLKVVVEGAANEKNLGSTNTAGLSTDGKTLLVSDTTSGKDVPQRAQGWRKAPLVLDAKGRPELSGIREFYLHVVMKHSSSPTVNSNRITKIEVSAVAE